MQLDVVDLHARGHAFVVVVDRDREHLLGAILADDVRIEVFIDLGWGGQFSERQTRLGGSRRGGFFVDDLAAQIHAFVADVDRARASNQPADLILTLTAKRTVILTASAACCRHVGCCAPPCFSRGSRVGLDSVAWTRLRLPLTVRSAAGRSGLRCLVHGRLGQVGCLARFGFSVDHIDHSVVARLFGAHPVVAVDVP